MIRYFGANVGIEEVIGRTADIVVDDHVIIDPGNKKVQIMHWGVAQTPGDLFVWVPDEKVFWTGNPLVAPPPALPWLLEGGHEAASHAPPLRVLLDKGLPIGMGRPIFSRERKRYACIPLAVLGFPGKRRSKAESRRASTLTSPFYQRII